MGRVQYPENEIYVNFYSGAIPYYTDGYQLLPHPPPSAMQAMRGNNFNSRPQVPSSSSNRPQMNPQPRQHNTLPYSSGSMDDWNPSIPLGQMTTAEDPLPSIGSIFRRLDMLREHTANLMLRDNFAFTSYEVFLVNLISSVLTSILNKISPFEWELIFPQMSVGLFGLWYDFRSCRRIREPHRPVERPLRFRFLWGILFEIDVCT